MKLSNIQKESEKIKIRKSINDYEDLKTHILLKLGIITYDKIRKGEIIDEDFDSLCDEIKNYDIEIYTKYMQLRNFENENKRNTCQCGYIAFKNEKFCPQCGKSLIEEEEPYIICPNCNQNVEKDSNFCVCCGSKIKQEFVYDNEPYCDDNDVNSENGVEYVEKLDQTENLGKEFLEKQEELLIEEYDCEYNTEIDKESTENSIEVEGREFLKSHQDNTHE